MAQISFQQGEDLIINLALLEAGIPLDITAAIDIRVQAYIIKSNIKTKVFAYSKNPKSGYGVCRQKAVVGDEHIVEVLLTRSQTITFDAGVVSFAVIITMPGGGDFPDGLNTEYNFDNFGTVLEGCAKDEVIP